MGIYSYPTDFFWSIGCGYGMCTTGLSSLGTRVQEVSYHYLNNKKTQPTRLFPAQLIQSIMTSSDKEKEDVAKLLRKVTAKELDDVIELLEEGVDVNCQEVETWETPLHKAARVGAIEIAKVLIEKKADANAECIKGRTCLHVACETYDNDETGDFAFEDIVELLVKEGGALSIEDAEGKLPNPGEDCCTRVESAVERAFNDGKDLRKEHAASKKERNKMKMDKMFEDKLVAHLSTTSAATVAVRESPSRPDGWG